MINGSSNLVKQIIVKTISKFLQSKEQNNKKRKGHDKGNLYGDKNEVLKKVVLKLSYPYVEETLILLQDSFHPNELLFHELTFRSNGYIYY